MTPLLHCVPNNSEYVTHIYSYNSHDNPTRFGKSNSLYKVMELVTMESQEPGVPSLLALSEVFAMCTLSEGQCHC
jgi:hypothetical protein